MDGSQLDLFNMEDVGEHGAQQPASDRRAGKSYSGCLTCRQRKIKCDETRPHCMNCERSRRYTCRGYPSSGSTTARGPRVPRNRRARALSGHGRQPSSSAHTFAPERSSQQVVHPTDTSDQLFCVDEVDPFAWFPTGDDNALALPPIFDDTDFDFLDLPYDAAWVEAATSTQVMFQIPRRGSTILQDAQEDEEEETELLAHYRDVVCNYMMPTIDPRRNPWLRLYLPLAMSVHRSRSKLALRHALKSVAASQLAQTSVASRARHLAQAVNEKSQASELVHAILANGIELMEPTDKYALLATAMTLISTDVFGIDNTDCRIHLDLAKRIVRDTGGPVFWSSTSCSKALIQILRCYDLMGSTIRSSPTEPAVDSHGDDIASTMSHSIDGTTHPSSADETFDVLPNEVGSDDQYILDLSFGLSRETFALLRDTLELGRQCAKPRNTITWWEEILVAARSLKQRLSNADAEMGDFPANQLSDLVLPDSEDRDNSSDRLSHPVPDKNSLPPIISQEALENHQKSFHYAVLLYFYRLIYTLRIQCSEELRRPLKVIAELDDLLANDCQLFVGKIFDCLETVDAVTTDSVGRPGNTLWPAFVAAAEATKIELRQRALIWLARASRRGLGNIVRSKEVIMETWRRVDRLNESRIPISLGPGLGPVDWRSIMEERGAYIMLA